MAVHALAVDFGGSHVTCALVDEQRAIDAERIATEAGPLEPLLPELAARLRALLERNDVTGCLGVGVSFCGLVDARGGRITATNGKYDDATRIDLVAWGAEALRLPLRVENDARMALLGERAAGGARGFDDVVLLAFGTGIGSAVLTEGRLLRGKSGHAGSLVPHFTVRLDGRRCTCGNVGCAESEAAGWSLPLVARESASFATSALAATPRIDFETLFRCAREGDAVAVSVREHCLRVWGATVVTCAHTYAPDVVLLSGGVMQAADEILPSLEAFVAKHAWTAGRPIAIRRGELGRDAPLVGAVPLLTEREL